MRTIGLKPATQSNLEQGNILLWQNLRRNKFLQRNAYLDEIAFQWLITLCLLRVLKYFMRFQL